MTDVNTLNNPNTVLQANILTQIERLKALAEREQNPELAAKCQLIAEVIGEGFEQIATGETDETAILSERELWLTFINSEVHLSTGYGPTDVKFKPAKLLDDGVMLWEEIALINEQLFSDEGSTIIGEYIDELETYLKNLKTVHFTFELEKDTYRLRDDENDGGEERYNAPDYSH